MSDLLEHLGKDTLPKPLVDEFVRWCVYEQARPALLDVLEKADIKDIAASIRQAHSLVDLARLGEQASAHAKSLRGRTGPLGLSAAEAAAFEFTNLTRAASEDFFDAEGVAFFSSRVCGWAGWASTDFSDPGRKAKAEGTARQQQNSELERLWKRYSPEDA